MAAGRIASLVVLLSVLTFVCPIKDGREVSQCDYPGLVLVVLPVNGVILCNGVQSNGVLYLPYVCGIALEDILPLISLTVIYGDETKNMTLPINSTGTFNNGIFQMNIPEPMEAQCNVEATLFNTSMTINNNMCEVVGFGSDQPVAKTYDGIPRAAALTKSTSVPCCKVIFNSLTTSQRSAILNQQAPFNCVASSGAVCGLGDLGAPVYCKTSAGELVVLGLAASFPCESGGTFLLHEFTDGDPSFKFGITGR